MTEADREEYEERAAIIEYDGRLAREAAEKRAFIAWSKKDEKQSGGQGTIRKFRIVDSWMLVKDDEENAEDRN